MNVDGEDLHAVKFLSVRTVLIEEKRSPWSH